MTLQRTPEHPTAPPPKTNERIFLQPWFLLAVLCVVAMVLLVLHG